MLSNDTETTQFFKREKESIKVNEKENELPPSKVNLKNTKIEDLEERKNKKKKK